MEAFEGGYIALHPIRLRLLGRGRLDSCLLTFALPRLDREMMLLLTNAFDHADVSCPVLRVTIRYEKVMTANAVVSRWARLHPLVVKR
jgi:hypothetical protein